MSDLRRRMALYRHCARHLPSDAEALQSPRRRTVTRFRDAANLCNFRVASSCWATSRWH